MSRDYQRSIVRAIGWVAWLALVCWKLTTVPGMHMDEGWNIGASRGFWDPVNPLSGMTFYSGALPRWLLDVWGSYAGLWVLRGASVLANAGTLLLLAALLRRLLPEKTWGGWALALVGTTPVWLVTVRHALEVLTFTPLLSVLGLYLLVLQRRWAAFAAGVSWGLSIYSHLIGVCFPVSVGLAWLAVYWRRPPVAWGALLAGFVAGLAPRLIAIALYGHEMEGSAASYALDAALSDLRWVPRVFWDTLTGQAVFLRYVGAVQVEVWPYWLLGLLLLIPWLRAPLAVPRHVWFTLLASVLFAVLAALEAPYLAVRFTLLPVIGLSMCAAQLGAAAIARDGRWAYLVRPTAGLLVAAQLFYVVNNFYLPWQRDELQFARFFLGERSPATASEGFLPKQELVEYLLALDPRPDRVLAQPSLQRPLRALLEDPNIEVLDPVLTAERTPGTVFADYRRREGLSARCTGTAAGRMCFRHIEPVGKYFIVGR